MTALPLLSALFAVTMLLNGLGWVFKFYDAPGFDEASHGLTTTALTGLFGYFVFKKLFTVREVSLWHLSTAILSLGIAIGAVWEVVEWFMFLVSGNPGIIKSLNDTVSDLIWDVLGATLALPLLWQDALRASRGESRHHRALFHWRACLAIFVITTAIWVVAENRGDDVQIVEGKRQITEAHRNGKEVEVVGRVTDEDLYQAMKDRPEEFAGKMFIIRKSVISIVNPTTIKIDADGLLGESEIVVSLGKDMLPEKLAEGDQIEILGTTKMVDGEPTIICQSVLDFAGDE